MPGKTPLFKRICCIALSFALAMSCCSAGVVQAFADTLQADAAPSAATATDTAPESAASPGGGDAAADSSATEDADADADAPAAGDGQSGQGQEPCDDALAGAPELSEADAAALDPDKSIEGPDAAGSAQIEEFSAAWDARDAAQGDDAATLSVQSDGEQVGALRLKAHARLSAEHDWYPGSVRVKLPAKLLADAAGAALGTWSIDVPAKDAQPLFSRAVAQNGSIIVVNTQTISAAASLSFEFSLENLTARDLHLDAAPVACAPFVLALGAVTHEGVSLSKTSDELSAQVAAGAAASDTAASPDAQEASGDAGDARAQGTSDARARGKVPVSVASPDFVGPSLLSASKAAETVAVAGTVTWDNSKNEAGGYYTPDLSFTLALYANGVRKSSVYMNVNDAKAQESSYDAGTDSYSVWKSSYSFGKQAKYDAKGAEVSYELKVEAPSEGGEQSFGQPGTYGQWWTPKVDGYNVEVAFRDDLADGELVLEKKTQGAPASAQDDEFTFTLHLYTERGNFDLTRKYPYTTSDGRSGQIADGQTLVLKGGQTATVKGVGNFCTYAWSEQGAANWKQSDAQGGVGTTADTTENDGAMLVPVGESSTTTFTNTYDEGFNPDADPTLGTLALASALAAAPATLKDTEPEFSYTLELKDASGTALSASYPYTTSDGGSGTVASGGTIKLKGGQTATVSGLPANTAYSWEQGAKKGWQAVSSEGKHGKVSGGAASRATFTNKYRPCCDLALATGKKTLSGATLAWHQFAFNLVDDATGAVVRTARNDEKGAFSFNQLDYTVDDAGKTFSYTVVEVDEGEAGIVYDTHQEKVSVKVEDDGYGTLTATPSYDDDGIAFANAYRVADLELSLTAYKNLVGRDLAAGEFSFQLADQTGKVVATGANDASGKVAFSKLSFSMADLGQTYTYTASEVAGNEAGIVYDTSTFRYVVKVVDAGGGVARAVVDQPDGTPEFTNTCKPGSLRIEKRVEEGSDANQDFTFHVALSGKNLPEDGTYTYTHEQLADAVAGNADAAAGASAAPADAQAGADAGAGGSAGTETEADADGQANAAAEGASGLDLLVSAATRAADAVGAWFAQAASPEKAYAATVVSRGTSGTVTWTLDSDGLLTFAPTSGSSGTLADVKATYRSSSWTTSGQVVDGSDSSWNAIRTQVKSVKFTGAVHTTATAEALFAGMANATSIDLAGLDTSAATDLEGLFADCSSLEAIDVSALSTGACTSDAGLDGMFSFCTSLKSLDLSAWNTSGHSGKALCDMFLKCSALETLNLSNFTFTNTSNSWDNFTGCAKLSKVCLPGSQGSAFVYSRGDSECGISDPTRNTATGVTGKWIRQDKAKGPWTVAQMQTNWNDSCAGWWIWEVKSPYTVKFDANGSNTTGTMAPTSFSRLADNTVPACAFSRFDYDFVEWNTEANGTGTKVAAGASVGGENSPLVPEGTDEVTLYAQWRQHVNETELLDGGFDITIKGGEAAVVDNLPAGVGYVVTEKTPSGWVVVSKSGDAGQIAPATTSTASFTNKESAGAVQVNLSAQTTLDGKPAAAGKFNFILNQGGSTLQSKANVAGGAIVFDPLTYEQVGTYEYTISEVAGGDAAVEYATDTFSVVVTVSKNDDGSLSADIAYKSGGEDAIKVLFANTSAPGSLEVVKAVEGTGAADKDFSMSLKLEGVESTDGSGVSTEGFTLKAGEKKSFSIPAGVRYTISEDEGSMPAGYKLKGIEGASGTIAAGATSSATVTNSYAASGTATISGTTSLQGRALAQGEFTLLLKDADGRVVSMAACAADGSFSFDAIPIRQAGISSYTVCEQAGTDADIVYDSHTVAATVTAADKGDGTLSTSVSYAGGACAFVNTMVDKNLTISKKVAGTQAEDADFTFTVKATRYDGTPYTGTTGGCTFNAAGEATLVLRAGQSATLPLPYGTGYTISETPAAGYTAAFTNGSQSGTLDTDHSVEVTNTYAASGVWTARAKATLSGAAMTAGQFSFALLNEKGAKVASGVNAADGSVSFAGLGFSDAGEKSYTMVQVAGGNAKIDYDGKRVAVKLVARDKGDGTLAFDASYDGASDVPVFDNIYSPEPAKVSFSAKKQLDGRALQAGEFSFVLCDPAGNELQTAVNDADGNVSFDAVEIARAGEREYRIFEVEGEDSAIGYSSQLVLAKSVVVAGVDAQSAATLVAEPVVYSGGDGEAGDVFTNTFTAPSAVGSVSLGGIVGLVAYGSGQKLDVNAGEFSFAVFDANGDAVKDGAGTDVTATCGADGSFTFPAIELAYDEAMEGDGTDIVYTVKQVAGAEAGVSYDVTSYTATVHATRNSETNEIETSVSYAPVAASSEDAGNGEAAPVAEGAGGEGAADEGDDADTGADEDGDADAGASASFTNVYRAQEPLSVSVAAQKQLDGRALAAGEFSFSLADEAGAQVAAGTNAADGTVSFDALSFDVAGSYSYTMTEQAGTAEGVAYDTASHAVSVTVSHAADRSLQAAVSYDGTDAAPIFKNSYTAPSAEPEDADDTPASDEPAAGEPAANTGQAAAETPASTSAAAAKEKVNAGTPFTGDAGFALQSALIVAALAGLVLLAASRRRNARDEKRR